VRERSTTYDGAAIIDEVRRYWGYDTLRPLQSDAIRATLEHRDSLVVMPTGGGKSLCYQVPPLLTERLTVVVSPLIALMKDQVDGLRVAGYPAAALHSNLDQGEQQELRAQVTSGETRLLLVAPERLLTAGFLSWLAKLHDRSPIGAFAIDEAHCISQWGHDFRPEYRRLAELRGVFPDVPFNAYTATATPRVREDIAAQLGLVDPAVLVGTFDRPNLTYRVLPRVKLVEQVAEALRRHEGRAAIVYCISRNDTETLAENLRSRGIDARPYHAGLDAAKRTRTQGDFKAERLNVVVATVAFGMGIDRGDVRCVVHAAMPKTVEHYQQETGRAGRDGLPAECVLFYSSADVERWKRLAEKGAAESEGDREAARRGLETQLELLGHVQRLCSSARCRHRALSEYFGQEYTPPAGGGDAGGAAGEGCGACDVCLRELDEVEGSQEIARKVLSCVYRVGQQFGAAHVADVLRGSRAAKIVERGHHELSTFGLLKDLARESLLSYMHQLIDAGVLARSEGDFPTLRLTSASQAVLRNERTVALHRPRSVEPENAPAAGGGPSAAPLTGDESRLFEALRGLRRQIAEELKVPPYVVFGDATLEEIAKVRPGSLQSLLGIRGIGHVKLEQFGERFVVEVGSFCERAGLALDAAAGSRPRAARERGRMDAKPRRSRPRVISGEMFAKGSSLEEVAETLGIERNTAAAHLAEYIGQARPGTIERWVDDETYKAVADAAGTYGTRMLRPIFEHLGGRVPYEQIRLVVTHLSATPVDGA